MRKRAIDDAEKAQRRQTILNAASDLYVRNPDKLPSVSAIATQAGLAKGTVYLYFKTKEEMFLALLADQFFGLLDQLTLLLAQPDSRLEQLPHALLAWLREHPVFLPLASRAYTVIEQNLPTPIALEFKRELAQKLNCVGGEIHHQFGVDGVRLLMETHAILLGTWQMLDWPAGLREHLDHPDFAVFNVPFEETLLDILSRIWRADSQ